MYKYMPDFAFRHKTEPDPHLEETELKAHSYAMLTYSHYIFLTLRS